MSRWTPKYSQEQRDAIERAFLDLRIRPAPKIAAMALAGELRAKADGPLVESFEIPVASVRYIGHAAERRRLGKAMPVDLESMPARDRAVIMQKRLSAVAHHELARLERQQRLHPDEPVDGEAIRKLSRALRELSTVPDPSDMRLPRTPGERVPGTGEQPDGATRDGLAGAILRASDRSAPRPAPGDARLGQSEEQTPALEHAGEHGENERINALQQEQEQRQNSDGEQDRAHEQQHEHGQEAAPDAPPRVDATGLLADGLLVA